MKFDGYPDSKQIVLESILNCKRNSISVLALKSSGYIQFESIEHRPVMHTKFQSFFWIM